VNGIGTQSQRGIPVIKVSLIATTGKSGVGGDWEQTRRTSGFTNVKSERSLLEERHFNDPNLVVSVKYLLPYFLQRLKRNLFPDSYA
jgi:hypothetical protein